MFFFKGPYCAPQLVEELGINNLELKRFSEIKDTANQATSGHHSRENSQRTNQVKICTLNLFKTLILF